MLTDSSEQSDEGDDERSRSDDDEDGAGIVQQWRRLGDVHHVQIVDDGRVDSHPYPNAEKGNSSEL